MNDNERRIAKAVAAASYLSRLDFLRLKETDRVLGRIIEKMESEIEVQRPYNLKAARFFDAFGICDPEEVLP